LVEFLSHLRVPLHHEVTDKFIGVKERIEKGDLPAVVIFQKEIGLIKDDLSPIFILITEKGYRNQIFIRFEIILFLAPDASDCFLKRNSL